MTHRVVITQRAKDDLRHYYQIAAKHAPDTAASWLNNSISLFKHSPISRPDVITLQRMTSWSKPIFQLIYGKRRGAYRALFTIDGVLHIRRGTMDKAQESDLAG